MKFSKLHYLTNVITYRILKPTFNQTIHNPKKTNISKKIKDS